MGQELSHDKDLKVFLRGGRTYVMTEKVMVDGALVTRREFLTPEKDMTVDWRDRMSVMDTGPSESTTAFKPE